jgi:hypothetical protein
MLQYLTTVIVGLCRPLKNDLELDERVEQDSPHRKMNITKRRGLRA